MTDCCYDLETISPVVASRCNFERSSVVSAIAETSMAAIVVGGIVGFEDGRGAKVDEYETGATRNFSIIKS